MCRSSGRSTFYALAFAELGRGVEGGTMRSEQVWEVGGGMVTSIARKAYLSVGNVNRVASHLHSIALMGWMLL